MSFHSHGNWAGAGLVAAVCMGFSAAVGFVLLGRAERDQGAVRRAGQAVGWTFVVFGMTGYALGLATHALKWVRRPVPPAAEAASADPAETD